MHLTRTRGSTLLKLCLVAVSLAMAAAAHAVPITGLFNTGVDNIGNALPANQNDPHYDLTFPTVNTEVTVIDTAFPIPPWVANNPFSRWIGPTSNGDAPSGNYTYRTTFSLPANANLNSASISGLWSTDDASIDILINGNSTGNTTGGHAALWPFLINGSGLFQAGLNTLDFQLNNSPLAGPTSPTGLRVDRIRGDYLVIPEPASTCLVVAALVTALGTLRHQSRTAYPTPVRQH